jgi:hypothetical protein
MSDQVKIGWIAGSAQVAAALVALFGVLFTAAGTDSAQGKAAATPTASTTATPTASATATPTSSASCTDVLEQYRRLTLQDPALLAALIAPGPDGISPIEADPDARRCGISAATLRAMR